LLRSSGALSSVKVVVSGGFGVGKTTFINTISEIDPFDTEAPISEVALRIDDTSCLPDKMTTTVALDFGRITLDPTLVLYLFGTPGQERFMSMWDDLSKGAIGAIVIADTRRIEDCFRTIEYFEQRCTPFLLAVNPFDGAERFDLHQIRDAVGVTDDVPVVECDARERESVKSTLLALLTRVLSTHDALGHA
jgi:signal recognition particle receptor subunit beta